MPIVLLVRHGENDYMVNQRLAGRTPGVHLNQTGQLQAEKVAENLKHLPIKAIYSSPLERTWETATPLAKALNLDVIPRQNLLEVDYGTWQGNTFEWLTQQSDWKVLNTTPSLLRFPQGESFSEVQSRMCSEISTLCSLCDATEMFACFTHGDLIRLAVAYYLGMPLDRYRRLYIGPASITAFEINEENIRLISINHEFTFPQQMS